MKLRRIILVILTVLVLTYSGCKMKKPIDHTKYRQQHTLKFLVLDKKAIDSFILLDLFSGKKQLDAEGSQLIYNILKKMEAGLRTKPVENSGMFTFKNYFLTYIQTQKYDSLILDDQRLALSVIKRALNSYGALNPIYPYAEENSYLSKLFFNYNCIGLFKEHWFGDNRLKFSQEFLNRLSNNNLDELLYHHYNHDNDSSDSNYLPPFTFMKFYEPNADNDEVLLVHSLTKDAAIRFKVSLAENQKNFMENSNLQYEYDLFSFILKENIEDKNIVLLEVGD